MQVISIELWIITWLYIQVEKQEIHSVLCQYRIYSFQRNNKRINRKPAKAPLFYLLSLAKLDAQRMARNGRRLAFTLPLRVNNR